MKTFLIRLAMPLLLAATASADWVVESTVEGPQVKGALTVKVKGDKMRMDIPNARLGAVSSIVDSKTGDALQIVHAQKVAMKVDGATIKQMIANAREKAGVKEGESPEAKSTGETEKVGEYDCDIYTWANGTISKKYWVAKSHPQAAAMKELEKQLRSGFFGAMQTGPDTSKLPGATIKTETTTATGTVTTIVTAIKEQDVDSKDFEVPEGYEIKAAPVPPPAK